MRATIERAIADVLAAAVESLVAALRANTFAETERAHLEWFAEQLRDAQSSPTLLRETFRTHVLTPSLPSDERVRTLRTFFGWKSGALDFDDLRPEFLDVIYLLPPRDRAVLETLLPIVEYARSGEREHTLFDIGTGTGVLIELLQSCGVAQKVFGIEPASKLAAYAVRRFATRPDVRITTHRVEHYKKEVLFTSALCYMVLHHVIDSTSYKSALKTVFECLSEGGILVYTDKIDSTDEHLRPRLPSQFKTLKSGQELEIVPMEFAGLEPFRPHPESIPEAPRKWLDTADCLSEAGFLIKSVRPLNNAMVLFECVKPRISQWEYFATKANPLFAKELAQDRVAEYARKPHAPYQWILECLKALYEDIAKEKCPVEKKVGPGFLRGIAYFTWEKASRLFLVRRAVPFDFHILSYSHVHEGWGSIGRMVEEFENNPAGYLRNKGYTCLTRDAVQRTLPFQGDIDELDYDAAMAVPVYRRDTHELLGAFLLFLAQKEDVPLHTGSALHIQLAAKFRELNDSMTLAVERIRHHNTTQSICRKWDELVKQNRGLIIGELTLRDHDETPGFEKPRRQTIEVCSGIQAMLSGRDCFSVLDESQLKAGVARILVAARHGLSYEEIRDKLLVAVGVVAERYGPFSYTCRQLGQPDAVE